MFNEVLKRFLPHLSSLSLVFIFLIIYVLGEHPWLDQYLPVQDRPVFVFLIIGLVLVYELSLLGQKRVESKVLDNADMIKDISNQLKVNRLIHSVNALYAKFIESGDQHITHEYTIKELTELKNMRDELKVNSYTQGKLEYLTSKIKWG